jgi:hypothetical protein
MEPRYSMKNYAVGLGCVLASLSVLRFWPLALGLSTVIAASGLALAVSYRHWMRRRTPPPHRLRLDRIVVREWLGAGSLGFVSALVAAFAGGHLVHLSAAVRVLQALVTGGAVALTAVFVSSLVDWYWILPRVGGLGDHEAPCQAPGERWKYPTAIWLLHRGVATAIVVASIAAVPFYLAGILGSPATKAILSVVGVAVGAGMAALNQKGLSSVTNAFNQPFYVGDTILINQAPEGDGALVKRRRAYVVDVSVQGVKYQYLENDRYLADGFDRKGHGPTEARSEPYSIARLDGPLVAPCRLSCSRVNWYCRNNPEAYDR